MYYDRYPVGHTKNITVCVDNLREKKKTRYKN